jgi:predicted GIY-YIG superfamily endonuclease
MKRKFSSLAGLVCLVASFGAFAWSTGDFNESGNGGGKFAGNGPETCRGVYVIRLQGSPYYVGRSANVRSRLLDHINGRGSRKVADQLGKGQKLSYEYECLDSEVQAEAILIKQYGTGTAGNLRRESDPADW